ncbi:Nuclear receptor coactivator 6 [Liparis tanakae]|uniref:Nuclear receptor coactivator 6 n=1 Tax=Liparis tanakae TaxID=230148 RepID=A0A4Z2GG91_9TELE|nr:Nuclear receptor coactivator 6 [Liparis tanakae]
MAHRCPPPLPSQGTEHLEPDNDSDRDSGVGEDADSCHGGAEEEGGGGEEEEGVNTQSGVEGEGSAVFIAFQGNMEDEDFSQKLECVLRGIPNMLALGPERLRPRRVEPWNSVRVTFNIPRDAAERLRLLAQNNQQQLRDLGILSVQIEGEGAINVAVGPIRGQEVRVNGPIGAPGQMRMDVGFPGQPGPGGVRMANPAMVPPGPGVAAQSTLPGGSGQLHPRAQMVPRPPSLATVQTPSHPPPPYPFGSQQAGQVFTAMGPGPLQQQAGQFAAPQLKGLQACPAGAVRPPPPLPPASGPQGNLAAKSPGSSSSPFQQSSPGTPPMMAQRPTTPQGFPQGVGSPGRAALGPPGAMQQGFMGMPQHGPPGAQGHPGMPKRPMGFPNPNFVQGQVSGGTPGTPVGGASQQLQSSQAMTHTGAPPSASAPNPMQGPPHVQPNVMGVQSGMPGLPPGTAAGPGMGQPPGLQSPMLGLQHQAQPVSSSPSQKLQGQGGGQTVLSRPLSQGQRGGMTPPKQMMPQQGQGVMHGQGQMVGGQGHQAMLLQQQQQQQQNSMMEQMHMQMGNGHFAAHGMNFNPQFQGQMPMAGACVQPGGFPVSKDVTLTSPLLVNLLQSDISASQFGPGGKQGPGGANQAKPKKKKPARKKKPKEGDAPAEGLGGLDGAAGLEDSELPNLGGEPSLGLDNASQKLPEFSGRPAGKQQQQQ